MTYALIWDNIKFMTTQQTGKLSKVWARLSDTRVVRGEGAYLYDSEGKRYLDFSCGIGVTNTGHCHPRVVAAIKDQAEKLIFGQMNVVYNDAAEDLAEELASIVPKGLDTFFFASSGAEAVESAVKLAKQATGRQNVIVFQGSFHGRTHLTMAMTTSKTVYRGMYQPLVGGIFVSPYPYSYYYGWDDEKTLGFALRELERMFASQSAPEETACVVVEPVLGEGGYVVPPKGFMRALRKVCSELGVLLVADEIQSGCGRTGEYFAVQHEDVTPDILIIAKGLGSGMPLSGIAYPGELDAKWKTGSHGGTYTTGNCVSLRAGAETVRVLKEEGLTQNARERGGQLLAGLKKLQRDFPVMGDVRGLGLMIAVEFTRDGEADAAAAKAVQKAALEEGLFLLSCGTFGNVIRFIPPLIVTEEQIDDGLEITAKALKGTA